jgi:hypothetical protein
MLVFGCSVNLSEIFFNHFPAFLCKSHSTAFTNYGIHFDVRVLADSPGKSIRDR